jgi:hypothetical protein
MRRRTATKTKSKKLVKKIKSFLIYSTLAIVLVMFVSQIFLNNILEYSFSLAKSGVGKDFKNSDKFNLLLVNKNSLNEISQVDLIIFDKVNEKLFTYSVDVNEENFYFNKNVSSLKHLFKNTGFNQDELVLAFEKNYGLIINHSMVFGNDEYQLYKKTVQGEIKLTDLGEVLSIKNIGIRNTFLMYSYSKDINVENKKSSSVSSIFQLDKEIKSIYLDSEIANEKLSISVVNATGINGLGKRVSRYVSNMGGRVVDVSSRNENLNKSVIIYKGESKSLEYLANILNIENKTNYQEGYKDAKIEHSEIIKSDIVIVLGLDISEDLR